MSLPSARRHADGCAEPLSPPCPIVIHVATICRIQLLCYVIFPRHHLMLPSRRHRIFTPISPSPPSRPPMRHAAYRCRTHERHCSSRHRHVSHCRHFLSFTTPTITTPPSFHRRQSCRYDGGATPECYMMTPASNSSRAPTENEHE